MHRPLPESFIPRDPAYAGRVRASFARQRAMALIGATLERVEPGCTEIHLPTRDDLTQQHGFIHGGVIGMVADSAAGYAAATLVAADAEVLTVEYKLNLVAPAEGEYLVARGEVVKSGRSLSITRADVFAVRAGAWRLCAVLQQTIMNLHARPGPSS